MLNIKKTLTKSGAAPLKKLGQNFLVSKTVLSKIIETANLKPSDIILEVGPGLGFLTFELAKKAKKVIAVEKDRKLSIILQQKIAKDNIKNIEVVQADALKIPNCKLPTTNYKLISNLPYNIATAVIMKFLESENPPELIEVMVQKEVAQRICARPPKMNKLAIFCQLYSTIKIVAYVSPSAFWPKPKVFSAILQLTPKEPGYLDPSSQAPLASFWDFFQKIVNAGFSHPRKQLVNNFSKELELPREKTEQWLKQCGIAPNQRAETLVLTDWQKLAKTSGEILIHN